ncbi:protein FAM151B [Austrofundulus limnaeus]|uniref:Protein FAM151B n=1 Tax=Austrofundulus limnaeus TaxID=52670 RepID=A0A2I4CT24_AUSLI|nr:PREDICTED: protein FAM151B-like [Austrofundulus limnaeus]
MGRWRLTARVFFFFLFSAFIFVVFLLFAETMRDRTIEYFLNLNQLTGRDAAEIRWSHAVNSRHALTQALTGPSHMVEADVILRGGDPREPVMAHPPDTDSDITLREWLQEVKHHQKGMKLDFKSLEAVGPSLVLLEEVLPEPSFPVWINADILCGPGGKAQPLDPESFLSAVSALPAHTVLSLGWTTGWTPAADHPGYSWDMVHQMQDRCRPLTHAVTFPVRAALLGRSFSQLSWLLQQSDRYSLTVWTGQGDEFTLQDLLLYRNQLDHSRIYYDLPDSVRTELIVTPRDRS